MSNVLGRGLDALLSAQPFQTSEPAEELAQSNSVEPVRSNEIRRLPICEIYPNPDQPRKKFSEEKLKELADSIRNNGVLQPIIVRKVDNGKYEIIAGERRWRAAQFAEMDTLPVIIRDDIDENELLKLALIENIQRDDLNPIEEAQAYQKLIHSYGLTQEEVAKMVSKKRSTITNSLRLLNLSINGQNALLNNEITMGHAKALLALDTAEDQDRFLREIKEKNWSVRDVEKYIRTYKKKNKTDKPLSSINSIDPFITAIETELMEALGTKVSIEHSKKGGKIHIHYYNNDDLDRIRLILKTKAREVA